MQRYFDRTRRFLALPIVPRLGTTVLDLVLIVWFGTLSCVLIWATIISNDLGWDALTYTHAVQALLAGGDAWAPEGLFGSFAGPPPSMLPYFVTAWLPDGVVGLLWTGISAASAIYVIRRLGLAPWWLLFPPVSIAMLAGSSALPVTALLVRGGAIADGVAIAARIYAAVPLLVLGRWKGFLIAAAIVIGTAPFLDWPRFLAALPEISATVVDQTRGGQSAAAVPWLIPIAAVCLILLGRRRAAWLLVPALWPYTQGYYAVIALPVIAEAPFVAMALTLNGIPGLVVLGLVAQVVAERLRIWPAEPARPSEGLTTT